MPKNFRSRSCFFFKCGNFRKIVCPQRGAAKLCSFKIFMKKRQVCHNLNQEIYHLPIFERHRLIHRFPGESLDGPALMSFLGLFWRGRFVFGWAVCRRWALSSCRWCSSCRRRCRERRLRLTSYRSTTKVLKGELSLSATWFILKCSVKIITFYQYVIIYFTESVANRIFYYRKY